MIDWLEHLLTFTYLFILFTLYIIWYSTELKESNKKKNQ